MNNTNYSDWIYPYLNNLLTKEQVAEFKEQLDLDIDLKKELLIQTNTHAILKNKDKYRFYRSMIRAEKTTKRRRTVKMVSSSAFVIILLLCGGWYFIDEKEVKMTNDEIFAQYYSLEKPGVIVRDLNQTTDSLSLGLQEFDLGHYENSLEILKSLNKQTPKDVTIAINLGFLLIESNKIGEAIIVYENVGDCFEYLLCEKLKWYLSLCYIKTGKIDKAVTILEYLASDENGEYKFFAKHVLKKI